MTEQNQNPAGVAPAGAPTPDPTGTAAGVTPATAAPGATPSGDDYLGKVRAHPDFAIEQVTKHQSRADRAEQELTALRSRLGTKLEEYLKTVEGDRLASIVNDHVTIANDPRASAAVSQFLQNGQWSGGGTNPTEPAAGNGSADDDVYLTDEERKIRALEEKITALEGGLAQQSSAQGRDALTRHLGRFTSTWGLDDEQKQKVTTDLMTQVQAWERDGERGQGFIRQLMSPQGQELVDTLAKRSLGDEGLLKVAEARLLRSQQTRGRMATDVPVRPATGSSADQPPAYSGALDDLEFIRSHPELLDQQGY